jgi:hypothetical protein
MLRQIVARLFLVLSASLDLSPQAAGPASATDPVIAAAGDIACRPSGAITATECHQQQTSDILMTRSSTRC